GVHTEPLKDPGVQEKYAFQTLGTYGLERRHRLTKNYNHRKIK
ncbi:MAG: Unknown protein, partial [uncultured Thiotrichaceae bacterium]